MKDRALWTIIVVIVVLALLDWMGLRTDNIVDSVRRLAGGSGNRLLGWGVLALVTYTAYRIINHLTKD